MKTPSDYLLAAKRCELTGLVQLRQVVGMVSEIAELVHCLQRERGASNLVLNAIDDQYQRERDALIWFAQQKAESVRLVFEALSQATGESAGSLRLFNRIALALVTLDGMPSLRERVEQKKLSSDDLIEAFSAVIANLLAVVTEAVDAAADPAVSRLLIALFYLMHGKELAGQERATGVAIFASGKLSDAQHDRLLRLIESSERCCEVFSDNASAGSLQAWQDLLANPVNQNLERMRRSLLSQRAQTGNLEQALRWFEQASLRLDGIREVEVMLCAELRSLCADRIEAVHTDLQDHASLLAKLPAGAAIFSALRDDDSAPNLANAGSLAKQDVGPHLAGSIIEMLQIQARKIQDMEDELLKAKTGFHESNLVERAKGLLMARQGLSAEQAHRLLRQTAMNQNRRLVDIAQATLTLVDLIPQLKP